MDEEIVKLEGKVQHIIFRNDNNFYTVFQMKILDGKGKSITATGSIDEMEEGDEFLFYGEYVDHPRFGLQFSVSNYEKALPKGEESVVKYLSSTLFEGIGRKTALKIVDALGENCIPSLMEDTSLLDTVPITAAQKESIREGLKKQNSKLSELIHFCTLHGIPNAFINVLHRKYGDRALERLQDNPYTIIEEVDGFGFQTADKLGMQLGFEKEDPRRLEAYLIYLTMQLCVRNGDSYIEEEVLEDSFHKKMAGLEYDFYSLLENCIVRRQLVNEEGHIFPITQYEAETGISDFLVSFPYYSMVKMNRQDIENALQDAQEVFSIQYDSIQKQAIESIFFHPIQIITGGPGTGKTTVVRAICHMFKSLYPTSTIVCAAPTGRASKRLNELTDMDSSTIHSLLQWDLESNTFGRNEENPVQADLLIIDEFSMVDSWLFYNLLKACKFVRKICIIGDEDQLPSVGPGCVLRDLIASNYFPVMRLQHIYRQKEGSDVINLAHQIVENRVDLESLNQDVKFFPMEPQYIQKNVCQIVQNALNKNYSIYDIQVLSPMYKGVCGIDALNTVLQNSFNPPSRSKKEVRAGFLTLREGDKILQLKNQPDDYVYNGDIGILEEILDARESEFNQTTLVVNFQDTYVYYTPDTFQNITLAYCISVHKSQGSEYPIVIMPISRQHHILLQKRLIYTAVTRSRRSLVLLGDREAFLEGVNTEERHVRNTSLKERLQQDALKIEKAGF